MHAEYTVRALKAGKPVLCEKRMATTPADCEQMVAAAKAARRKLMVGYRLRYQPFNQSLIKMAQDESDMGPTRLILAEAGVNFGDPQQWRPRRPKAGGGGPQRHGHSPPDAPRAPPPGVRLPPPTH